SGLAFRFGLVRNHYIGRTFIEPKQSIRSFGVRIKLNPVRHLIEGKRVVLIDDSIVRGTTSKKIVRMVREAGAKEIHVRISCPPTLTGPRILRRPTLSSLMYLKCPRELTARRGKQPPTVSI